MWARNVLAIANAREEYRRQFKENPKQREDAREAVALMIMEFEKSQTDPDPNYSIVPMSTAQRTQLAEIIITKFFDL